MWCGSGAKSWVTDQMSPLYTEGCWLDHKWMGSDTCCLDTIPCSWRRNRSAQVWGSHGPQKAVRVSDPKVTVRKGSALRQK